MSGSASQFADVEIEPVGSLEETAQILGKALGGLCFVKETTGRYEEYPAFTATREALRFDLLGPPDPEHDIRDASCSNDFQLRVRLSGSDWANRVDISAEVVGQITKSGLLKCRVLE